MQLAERNNLQESEGQWVARFVECLMLTIKEKISVQPIDSPVHRDRYKKDKAAGKQ